MPRQEDKKKKKKSERKRKNHTNEEEEEKKRVSIRNQNGIRNLVDFVVDYVDVDVVVVWNKLYKNSSNLVDDDWEWNNDMADNRTYVRVISNSTCHNHCQFRMMIPNMLMMLRMYHMTIALVYYWQWLNTKSLEWIWWKTTIALPLILLTTK